MPKSQGTGTLKGAWNSVPITVIIDRDFYATDGGRQAVAIKQAIATWNRWSNIKGFTAFEIDNDGTDATAGGDIPDTDSCAQSSFTNASPNAVGIWKIRSAADGRNYRGCSNTTDGKILSGTVQGQTDWTMLNGRIHNASILLNFDAFNTPAFNPIQPVDTESLTLHELGHVLGLLHSCDSDTTNENRDLTTAPSCFSGTTPFDFIDAVMFPSLGSAQLRRTLRQNDLNRINCLY